MSTAIGKDQSLAAATDNYTLAHPQSLTAPSPRAQIYRPENVPSGISVKGPSSTVVESVSISELRMSRTPSPTPSEAAFLSRKSVVDWERMKSWRFWIRKEWLWRYVIFAIVIALTVLIATQRDNIVRWIEPIATKLKKIPGNELIPIAILFVISFPPLFGHELIAMLCGVVYGLWVGFAVTAAGTFLGEIGNYYAFKYMCRSRGEKFERMNLQYACLARLVRTGGFKVALITRYSALPGHFTTAVFSTCGIKIFVFSLAALLSLPKQLALVYVGVVFEESGSGTETKSERAISATVLSVTGIITWLALHYIMSQMAKVKGDVVYERRKARKTKLERASSSEPRPSLSYPIGLEEGSSIELSVPAPKPLRTSAVNAASF